MGVEIKPFNGFPAAVYVDGHLLEKQTVEGPWVENGVVKVCCITDDRLFGPKIDPNKIPYQVRDYNRSLGTSGKSSEKMEITTLWLKLD